MQWSARTVQKLDLAGSVCNSFGRWYTFYQAGYRYTDQTFRLGDPEAASWCLWNRFDPVSSSHDEPESNISRLSSHLSPRKV